MAIDRASSLRQGSWTSIAAGHSVRAESRGRNEESQGNDHATIEMQRAVVSSACFPGVSRLEYPLGPREMCWLIIAIFHHEQWVLAAQTDIAVD